MSVLIEGMGMPTMPETFKQAESVPYIDIRLFADGTAVVSKRQRPYFIQYNAISIHQHGKIIDADKLIARLVEQRTVMLHELPAAHAREEGYTKEDYIFERNGDMISMLRNQAAVIPAEEATT